MEEVFRFKSWFLNAPGLIHGGAYYRNFTVHYIRNTIYYIRNTIYYILIYCIPQIIDST